MALRVIVMRGVGCGLLHIVFPPLSGHVNSHGQILQTSPFRQKIDFACDNNQVVGYVARCLFIGGTQEDATSSVPSEIKHYSIELLFRHCFQLRYKFMSKDKWVSDLDTELTKKFMFYVLRRQF